MCCDKKNAFTNGIYFFAISHIITETKLILGKTSGNSGMAHFAEKIDVPPPYSILQHVRRVATPKFVS